MVFHGTKRFTSTHISQKSELMKEITLRVPETMVRLIEEWTKHIPEMEVVSLKESGEYEIDEMNRRMALALQTLKQNGALRFGYDYTWIMVAIGDGAIEGMGGFRSPQSYMDYLTGLGVEHVPSRTTLSSWFGKVFGTYPEWEFIDTQDPQEIMRRKNVVRQLISALNKAKK
jgi:hypothetical protein